MKYNPPAGSQDPDAKYVTGQPGKVRGSAVPAEAVEHPQREIVEVIKQAGLTPSGDDLTQLYAAMLKIIGVQVPVASKTETGLVQIGAGLQITPEGLLSVLVATLGQNGIMRPDGTTCTVEDGVLKVLQQSNDYMEAWRKSWIGVPRYWRSTTLPDNHCWANGDLIYFNDWPELKEIYEDGGFEGMLMGWDADVETQKANLGKWRPNAAIPTGLYTPDVSQQFFRNWAQGADKEAGSWVTDTMRTLQTDDGSNNQTLNAGGIPASSGATTLYRAIKMRVISYQNSVGTGGSGFGNGNIALSLDTSKLGKNFTGVETAPQHVWQPVCLYLGRPAQV